MRQVVHALYALPKRFCRHVTNVLLERIAAGGIEFCSPAFVTAEMASEIFIC